MSSLSQKSSSSRQFLFLGQFAHQQPSFIQNNFRILCTILLLPYFVSEGLHFMTGDFNLNQSTKNVKSSSILLLAAPSTRIMYHHTPQLRVNKLHRDAGHKCITDELQLRAQQRSACNLLNFVE